MKLKRLHHSIGDTLMKWKCKHIDKMLYIYKFHSGYANTTFVRNKSIQDHLALTREFHMPQLTQYNNARLVSSVSDIKWSIIILDWNTPELTTECLKSVKNSYPSAEIILVQNGKAFETDIPFKIIKPKENVGFAKGCNLGAAEASGTHLLFLNSDTIMTNDVLPEFEKTFANPIIGAVGPYSDHAKFPQGDTLVKRPGEFVEVLSGFCLAIKKNIFEEVGGFDTQFTNFEDDDLCRKVRWHGYACYLANTWVHHKNHKSFEANNLNVGLVLEKSREKFHKKWPEVKVIAITLNELKSLPGFIEQFKSMTNRFAILDSGSTDGTIAWASQHCVEVMTRKFDNFSSQRNAAIKMLAGRAEWIITLDPDERLDENALKYSYHLIQQDKYDIFLSPLRAKNYDGTFTQWVPKPWIFRLSPDIKYIHPVHEKLIGSHRQALIINSCITHDLSLHDPSRRTDMAKFYDSLGKDDVSDDQGYPILGYGKLDDPRIAKITLGADGIKE